MLNLLNFMLYEYIWINYIFLYDTDTVYNCIDIFLHWGEIFSGLVYPHLSNLPCNFLF